MGCGLWVVGGGSGCGSMVVGAMVGVVVVGTVVVVRWWGGVTRVIQRWTLKAWRPWKRRPAGGSCSEQTKNKRIRRDEYISWAPHSSHTDLDDPRLQNFLPPVEALDVGAPHEVVGDALPVLAIV